MSEPKTYQPDDSGITVETLEFLHSTEGSLLRAQVAALLQKRSQLDVADVAALRKNAPAALVHAAIIIETLQSAARDKFPELPPGTIWALPEALEQATDSAVARHKAQQFHLSAPRQIYDLCCGVGGDALALAAVASTIAVDLSTVRLRCLEYNAQRAGVALETQAIDIKTRAEIGDSNEQKLTDGDRTFFHLDPARRANGNRSATYADLIPGPEVIEKLIKQFAGGALKLSPAVDFASLPTGHLELISHNRAVVQAVLWIGAMGERTDPQQRTATTLVNRTVTGSFTARPQEVRSISSVPPATRSHLYEVDGALTRAGLAAPLAEELGLTALTIDGGYVCAPAGRAAQMHHALTAFEVLATTPFSEKRVIDMLRTLPDAAPGPVEVKTRGRIPGIETDHLQRRFSTASPRRRTVLIYKCGTETVAVAANRLP